jgi:hypothetical protein
VLEVTLAEARLHLGEGRGITLPAWFLAIVSACVLGTSITIAGVAITTWSDVQADNSARKDFEVRIERLEASQADIAVVRQQVNDIDQKLDWFMNEQGITPRPKSH